MPHALLVKSHAAGRGVRTEVLAHDIASAGEARRLASALASSYPMHGVYDGGDVSWFFDGAGLREIWCQEE